MMRYPCYWAALNCVNNGGLCTPSMIELWGPPKSGKTLFSYDFFARNKSDDAILLIIDNELSTDELRLDKIFNLKKCSWIYLGKSSNNVLLDGGDIVKVDAASASIKESIKNGIMKDGDYLIIPSAYLEHGFTVLENILGMIDKTRPMFVIYDSISTQVTKSSLGSTDKESMFAGGRQEVPRVLKFFMARLLTAMYNKNILIFFINQVYAGEFKLESGGGFAFHHNIHISLFFKKERDIADLDDSVVVLGISSVKVTKNKFGPELRKGTMQVSVRDGGIILSDESIASDLLTYGVISHRGSGWYLVPSIWGDTAKRYEDILKEFKSTPEVRTKLLDLLDNTLLDIYRGVRLMRELGVC